MDVLIRADASAEIGTGHVMRCLTVAELLRQRGCSVTFMMKPLKGNLIQLVQAKGFNVVEQFQTTDICMIDHYRIDEQWENKIRPFVRKIVVIDDLANRRHNCDLLIDQNMVSNFERRYDELVPKNCVKLLGPRYLIIRDEFFEAREKLHVRTGEVRRLLIFMGGTDPTNETMKVIQALKQTSFFYEIDIVVGSGNPYKREIESICKAEGWSYHCQINYLALLMAKADFSIGAGGSTTWERCYVGLPSSSTVVAENQIDATIKAESLGVVWNVGWHEDVTVETYSRLLHKLKESGCQLRKMSELCLKLTENSNGPHSWVDHILEVTL